jgi:CRISPR-associated protein Cmr4
MESRLTFVYALSPLHAGTGQGAGVIDLPTAREKATGIPYLPGSSLKGALRTRCWNSDRDRCYQIFGPDQPDSENNAVSMILFSDQRLLLLPVRSLTGTFAWVTSPYILHRLMRDMADVGIDVKDFAVPDLAMPKEEDKDKALYCYVTGNSALVRESKDGSKQQVYLEDLDFIVKTNEEAKQQVDKWADQIGKWVFSNKSDTAWQASLKEHLCIVPDEVFSFLFTTATEIIARIRLKEDTKIVEQGGLWYEEALPTETILSGIALVTLRDNKVNGKGSLEPSKALEIIENLTEKTLQLGGKATVGRGLCRVLLPKGAESNANA